MIEGNIRTVVPKLPEPTYKVQSIQRSHPFTGERTMNYTNPHLLCRDELKSGFRIPNSF